MRAFSILIASLHASHAFHIIAPHVAPPVRPRAVTSLSHRDTLRNIGTAALASLVIVGSPMAAHAKGGGHGGGHSGGGSHASMSRSYSPSRSSSPRTSSSSRSSSSSRGRSSRSSSSSSSSSSSVSSPGRAGGRPPRSRSSSSRSPSRSPSPPVVYAPSPPVVYRSSPSVIVRDAPSVVYRTPVEDAYWNGVCAARLEAVAIGASAAYVYHIVKEWRDDDGESEPDAGGSAERAVEYWVELAETRDLMRELKAELETLDPLALAIDKPVDGTYGGESAEDDAGDQDVRTTLTFGRDGSIRGNGFDSVDGAYVIGEGRWSQKRVAWIETYDEGFTVALRGQVRPDGTIVALWASSRGIGGSVSLQAPTR